MLEESDASESDEKSDDFEKNEKSNDSESDEKPDDPENEKDLEQFEIQLQQVFPSKKSKKLKQRKESKKKAKQPNPALQREVDLREQQKKLLREVFATQKPQSQSDMNLPLFKKVKSKKGKKRSEKVRILNQLARQVNDILEEQDDLEEMAQNPMNQTVQNQQSVNSELA